MIFASVSPSEAEGATLAHSTLAGAKRIPKGTVLGPDHIAVLRDANVGMLEVARAEEGDMGENIAAARIARALASGNGSISADRATTGRVNLRTSVSGLFLAERTAVDHLNAIDPRVGLATLPDTTRVAGNELIATLKIVPFFLPETVVAAWSERAAGAIQVARWTDPLPDAGAARKRVAHISTTLPSVKLRVLDKTRRIFAERLAPTGADLLHERRVPHERAALADAIREEEGADLIVVFGASAVTDERDVVPAAIERAGGRIERVGMPVDPGNLLVLGALGRVPVLGAPGCARSPARNGFDLVLDRLLAGVPVRSQDIAAMGVGGLFKEAPRPHPREAPETGDGNE